MKNHKRTLVVIFYLAISVISIWAALHFLLPWLLPFIIAFIISRAIEPVVRLLTKRLKFNRAIASALCTIAVIALIIALISLIIGRVIYELTAFAKGLPELLTYVTDFQAGVMAKIETFIRSVPPETEEYLRMALDGVGQWSIALLSELPGKIMTLLTGFAALSPKLIIFILTCGISVFFISSGYSDVVSFILRQIPERHHTALRHFRADLLAVLAKWVRAELILSGITFCELLVAFLVLRIEYAILLALLIAFVDALPMFGVGAVLVPWSLISLITGAPARSVTLIITFGIIMVIRNVLEPKLVGSQIGLPSIAALVSMYVGLSAAGIVGMFLFPIVLIMLKNLNDRKYIRIWK